MQLEPIVAVFDSRTMAARTVDELRAAEYEDIWLAIVRGESADGQTLVAPDGDAEIVLYEALTERGTPADLARRFDGILPPGTAVMSLRVREKAERAARIIELSGGHIEHG